MSVFLITLKEVDIDGELIWEDGKKFIVTADYYTAEPGFITFWKDEKRMSSYASESVKELNLMPSSTNEAPPELQEGDLVETYWETQPQDGISTGRVMNPNTSTGWVLVNFDDKGRKSLVTKIHHLLYKGEHVWCHDPRGKWFDAQYILANQKEEP